MRRGRSLALPDGSWCAGLLHGAEVRVEAVEVVVEDEIGERDGHGDIQPLDEMDAADGEEEDLAGVEDALEDLRLLEGRVGGGWHVSAIDQGEAMVGIVHQREIPRRRDL